MRMKNLNEDLCLICLTNCKEPLLLSCCSNIICVICMKTLSSYNIIKCPHCREPLKSTYDNLRENMENYEYSETFTNVYFRVINQLKDKYGKIKNPFFETRVEVLEKAIERHILRIQADDNDNLIMTIDNDNDGNDNIIMTMIMMTMIT